MCKHTPFTSEALQGNLWKKKQTKKKTTGLSNNYNRSITRLVWAWAYGRLAEIDHRFMCGTMYFHTQKNKKIQEESPSLFVCPTGLHVAHCP